jgi:putative DNA primase/helicase
MTDPTLTESDLADITSNGKAFDPLPGEPTTELGYARRLIAVYGDRLRYVAAWKRWLVWDGRRWQPDTVGQVHRWQKVIARRMMLDAEATIEDGPRKSAVYLARRGESSAGVLGALKLASTEPGVAVAPEDLDADPFLLNCHNGVLDLRTGHLGDHNPELLLTKLAGAAYLPDAQGPKFAKFLERIQPTEDMRGYLARQLGHALEGRVVEHVVGIWFGAGANGTSTFINAVLEALGDYGDAADPQLLVARSFDAHPTGTADLFGLRLAVLHETDAGRRLAEGTVKRLTGGDRLKARRMREDFWGFVPSHTFVMLTNHRPVVGGTDEGIWRRIKLVPWEVEIPPGEQDQDLGDRLALEADAILTWAVDGYRDWRGHGLADPDKVLAATGAYRADSDAIARFIDQRCITGPHFAVQSARLFAAWSKWCAEEGEEHGTQTVFSAELSKRGFDSAHRRIGTVWMRIDLQGDDGK